MFAITKFFFPLVDCTHTFNISVNHFQQHSGPGSANLPPYINEGDICRSQIRRLDSYNTNLKNLKVTAESYATTRSKVHSPLKA